MTIIGHYLQLPSVIVSAPLFLIVGNYARTSGNVQHRRHRARNAAGRCAKCGFNLTGNISGICPECGTTVKTVENNRTQTQERNGRQSSECADRRSPYDLTKRSNLSAL